MARLLTPKSAYALMNAIADEALGKNATIQAEDFSSFVSVGETVLNTGIENVIGALSLVIGKTVVAIRPYKAKITLIQEEDTGLYTTRVRKISFYQKGAVESGWVNTDTHSKNLYNGYDNGTNGGNAVGSMWEQDKPVAIEFNFGGSSVWDFELTIYPDQLKTAFRSPDEFMAFWNGTIQSKMNDIEYVKESFNRMTLLNYIAGIYDMSTVMKGSVVNLTTEYNNFYGTNYTTAQLQTTYLDSFLAFMVSEIKLYSDYLTEPTVNYHWNPSKTVDGVTYTDIIRHTSRENQRLFLYSPIWKRAESLVLPQIFNPEYLARPQAEFVTYWQNQNNRMAISVTPAIPDTSDPSEQTTGTAVALDCVIGVLFDKDACITNFQFNGADTTPMEARKKYQNTWYHNAKNAQNDFTENGVIFIMADPTP